MIWLLACARPAPPAAPAPEPAPAPSAPSDRAPIKGPSYWTEPGGLCLEVPPGFSGSSGAPPLVLDLAQEGGFGVQIRVGPAGQPLPERHGFHVLFESPGGSYRSVPVLAPGASSATWGTDDPSGPLVQTWTNDIGGRAVEVAAIYPHGRLTEGELVLEPLLDSVCRTTLSPVTP